MAIQRYVMIFYAIPIFDAVEISKFQPCAIGPHQPLNTNRFLWMFSGHEFLQIQFSGGVTEYKSSLIELQLKVDT